MASRSARRATSTFRLTARHFYHHAGWAQLVRKRIPDHDRSASPDRSSVEFPAADAGLEDRAALAAGNTVVLKPPSSPVSALLSPRFAYEVGLPKGVVNIVTGDGTVGDASSAIPTSTRSPSPARPKWAAASAWPRPGPRKQLDARTRRQVAVRRLRRRRSRRRGGRRGRRHLVQPGPSLLRRLAPAGAGERRRRVYRQAARADGEAARRRSARQSHRHRRHRLPVQRAEASTHW